MQLFHSCSAWVVTSVSAVNKNGASDRCLDTVFTANSPKVGTTQMSTSEVGKGHGAPPHLQ